MAKKSTNDEEFLAQLRGSRGAAPHHSGMVMTKPPSQPSKSLEEVLNAAAAEALNTPETAEVEVGPTGSSPAPVSEGKVEIPLARIQSSPFQVRFHDDLAVEELMESIKDTQGLITPVVVRPLADGQFEAVAGHTRIEACRRLGYATVPAVVRAMDEATAAKALAADNLTRKDLSDYEIHKQLQVLFSREFIRSNSEASRLLGRSRQDVIRYQSYGRLPDMVLRLLETSPSLLGANCAKELADLTDEGHGEVVKEGVRRLMDGEVKNQASMLSWIRQKLTVREAANEFRVTDGRGLPVARVSVSPSGSIRITGNDLDLEAVEALLKRELPACRKAPGSGK